MTKSRKVVQKIQDEAKRQGLSWGLDRQGGNHAIYSLDGVKIPIGRHKEIHDRLAEKIYRECEPKLGKGWWRQ